MIEPDAQSAEEEVFEFYGDDMCDKPLEILTVQRTDGSFFMHAPGEFKKW